MKDRGDGISSSQASATGLLQLLSSGRGSRRDDDHDGDHYHNQMDKRGPGLFVVP